MDRSQNVSSWQWRCAFMTPADVRGGPTSEIRCAAARNSRRKWKYRTARRRRQKRLSPGGPSRGAARSFPMRKLLLLRNKHQPWDEVCEERGWSDEQEDRAEARPPPG